VHDATTFISDVSFIWFVYANFQIKDFLLVKYLSETKFGDFFYMLYLLLCFFFSRVYSQGGVVYGKNSFRRRMLSQTCEQYFLHRTCE
jgi:hypothetical protein